MAKKKKGQSSLTTKDFYVKKLKEINSNIDILKGQCGTIVPLVVPSAIHNLAVINPEISHEMVHDTFVLVNQALICSPLRYFKHWNIAKALLRSYFQLAEMDKACKELDDIVAAERVAWQERVAEAEAKAKAEGKKLKDKEPFDDRRGEYPIIDLSSYVNLVMQFYELRDFDKMESNVKYRKKLFARISSLAVRVSACSKMTILEQHNKKRRYESLLRNLGDTRK